MVMSIAAKHAKGKAAQDKIFGANAAAVAAAAKYGKDAVTNATIGAILDEDENRAPVPPWSMKVVLESNLLEEQDEH